MEHIQAYDLSVFLYSNENDGGNPTTIFLGATDLTSDEMKALAKKAGHECGFVLPAPSSPTSTHYTMRYFVPNQEMEMCGHATVGAIWLLHQLGKLTTHLPNDLIRISTLSGIVDAKILPSASESLQSSTILVSQPKGTTQDLHPAHTPSILSSLGLTQTDLATDLPIQNARTSRTKTLIPLKSREVLQNLRPDPEAIVRVCESVDSTGLYPYVVLDAAEQLFEARQFPRSAGYVEDPATGIAAAALVFGLVGDGCGIVAEKPVRVRQGWAMGKASEIRVCLRQGGEGRGWWGAG
ncbi:hypothetical protein N7454_008747 [Penicillium verhagenii]|nr:hypothetical protein N7454_008747 [Penicillium verhagenii]